MKVYDCVLFEGTIDELVQRFETLDSVVDVFVVVEPAHSRDGSPRQLVVRNELDKLQAWWPKLRHVIVPCAKPTSRRRWWQHLRNQIPRALADANKFDQVVISNSWIIPSADSIRWLRELTPDYSRLAKRGPDGSRLSRFAVPVAFQADRLDKHHAAGLCKRAQGSERAPDGAAAVAAALGAKPPLRWWLRSIRPVHVGAQQLDAKPMIICAYLHDSDEAVVRKAFGLDEERGKDLPFFLWQDTERIGPERAFQHCWSQFPDRDVIIVHPDMRPMPDDTSNSWYTDLIAYAESLPDAGIIGCDLIFPDPTPDGEVAAQCVGGRIRREKVRHVGGRKHAYDSRYSRVRKMDWATFGGVLIRRETINLVGSFDDDYKWAYVADVDYCMQTSLRGLRIYQVPVNLIHEENGTTKEFLVDETYRNIRDGNLDIFAAKWNGLFRGPASAGRKRVGGWFRFPGS